MGDEVSIRLYNSDDCKEIINLFYNTVHSVNARDYNEEQLNAWAPKEIDSTNWNKSFLEHYSIVAEKNDIIVGFGDIDNTGYFDKLYTHKDYQTNGIATKIADKLENHALENKATTITTHASITAKPFFEKRGYLIVTKQIVQLNGQSFINFIMEKSF